MKLVSAKCPNCGADIKVDKTSENAKCEYCNSHIIVDDAIAKYKLEVSGKVEVSNLPSVNNLIKLGMRHYEDEEYEEAYSEFSKAIELDPDNSELILFKGLTKSLMTNYLSFDLESAVNGYKNAIKGDLPDLAKDKYTTELIKTIQKLQNFAMNFYYKSAFDLNDLMGLEKRLNGCLAVYEYAFSSATSSFIKSQIVVMIDEVISFLLLKKKYRNANNIITNYTISYKNKKNLEAKRNNYFNLVEENNSDDPNIDYIKNKKQNEQKENLKKKKISLIVAQIFAFSMIIFAFQMSKYFIFGLILIVDFIIMIPKISDIIFKEKKKQSLYIKIILGLVGIYGAALTSYPSFILNDYTSPDMTVSFKKDKILINQKEFTYNFKTADNKIYLITAGDYSFEYANFTSKYLFCLLEDNQCKIYFKTDTSSSYIKNEEELKKYLK